MAVDTNLTEGVTLFFDLVTQSIGVAMTPPLVYYVAIALGIIVMSTIWKFLKPKRSRGN